MMNSMQAYQLYSPLLHPKIGEIGKGLGLSTRREPNNSVSISMIILLILFEITPFLQDFFGAEPFLFLGKISFGLYLIHPFVLSGLIPYLTVTLNMLFPLHVINMICFIVYMVVSIFTGYWFTKRIDEPTVILSHYVYNCFSSIEDKYQTPVTSNSQVSESKSLEGVV